eukprot:5835336-Amphidinium_carterae.1
MNVRDGSFEVLWNYRVQDCCYANRQQVWRSWPMGPELSSSLGRQAGCKACDYWEAATMPKVLGHWLGYVVSRLKYKDSAEMGLKWQWWTVVSYESHLQRALSSLELLPSRTLPVALYGPNENDYITVQMLFVFISSKITVSSSNC